MAFTAPTVVAYFDLPAQGGSFFTLDDTTKGVLNSATYVLAGDVGTDISAYVTFVDIKRGRTNLLEDIPTGVATLQLNNHDRRFDPLYTAGPYYGNLTPKKKITISVGATLLFVGRVEDWEADWGVDQDAVATVTVVDNLGNLAGIEFDEWTATAAQAPGARVTAILNRSEVAFPGGARSIDTGVSTLQGDAVSWGSNVLNYAQLVARSDLGYLFDSREGVLTFRDRHANLNDEATVNFADTGAAGTVPFHGIVTRSTSDLLYTSVSVDAEGLTAQTVTDSTAVTNYGASRLALSGLLLNSTAQALDMANYLLGLYKNPLPAIGSLTVKVHALDGDVQTTVLSSDLANLARVTWTPMGVGDPIDKYGIIEGFAHQIDGRELTHEVTFHLSDANRAAAFTLDDAQFGILGSSVLAF